MTVSTREVQEQVVDLEGRIEILEELVANLHLVEVADLFSGKKARKTRATRHYSAEERKAIGERLRAGRLAKEQAAAEAEEAEDVEVDEEE